MRKFNPNSGRKSKHSRSYGVHRAMLRMKRSVIRKEVRHAGKPKPAARRNIQL